MRLRADQRQRTDELGPISRPTPTTPSPSARAAAPHTYRPGLPETGLWPEIAETVDYDQGVDDELRHLLAPSPGRPARVSHAARDRVHHR